MKINLPAKLIATLLDESQAFREYVAQELEDTDPKVARDAVENILSRNKGNKIGAIKELREFAVENRRGLVKSYPFDFDCDSNLSQGRGLGLADAKKFVEKYGVFH